VLRLLGGVAGLRQRYPHFFRKGLAEYIAVLGVVFYALLIGIVSLYFENIELAKSADNAQPLMSLEQAFWFSTYSMFAGEPTPHEPQTLGGK